MIGRYVVLAGRIRQELAEIGRLVGRIARAVLAASRHTADADLFLDSAALNLHDFYSGLERIFTHIASTVDQSVPSGHNWHRELLRQMAVEIPGLRPQAVSAETARTVDEYLRFRHVVRHIYAFEFDAERVERLASRLRPTFETVRADLVAFATFLEGLAQEE